MVNKENHLRIVRKDPQVDRKVCPTCKTDKAMSDYYYEPIRSDGLSWECKECTKAKVKKWYEDNPDRKRSNDVYSRELKHVDGRDKEHDIEFRRTHPNYQNEWREKNREYVRTYHRNYMRERYQTDRSNILQYMKDWRAENPDKARVLDHKRISRHHALPFNITEEDIGDVFEMFGECCAFCGSDEDLELDHVIPVSWDDPSNPGTVRGNLMPLCGACNVSKSDKFLEEYLADEMLWMVRFKKSLEERGMTAEDLEIEIKFLLHMSGL